ncbi:MAG: hypothetical protein MNPFHGCM_01497 [Gemmatimonadaceae bacterium]|nr:hypothetical protein [Gemmatimonadaceae bacterium]
MTNDELERLASLIAAAIAQGGARTDPGLRKTWLPAPIRPSPPERTADLPPWTGAAQPLGDVAPIRTPIESPHRPSTTDLTRATRAAAAGRGTPVLASPTISEAPTDTVPSSRGAAARRKRTLPVKVPVAVSRRHVHLSGEHIKVLFGTDLTVQRTIKQPGQFAANEVVEVVGPKGRIEGLRVVGPARGETQLEIARSDSSILGIEPPVSASGNLGESVGRVSLVGPYGRVDLRRGAIVAARHLHLSPEDARRWGFSDGDVVDVSCGVGARTTAFAQVLVRCGPTHATELHLDVDEANAADVRSGDTAYVVAWREGARGGRRRVLITERDVLAIARAKGSIPEGALLTPSARDRAFALRLLT